MEKPKNKTMWCIDVDYKQNETEHKPGLKQIHVHQTAN